jgi:hypothetical protein
MAIVRLKFSTHPQDHVIRPFARLGLAEEYPVAKAAMGFDRLPLLDIPELQISVMLSHADSFPLVGAERYPVEIQTAPLPSAVTDGEHKANMIRCPSCRSRPVLSSSRT